jgi:hypothetical protein
MSLLLVVYSTVLQRQEGLMAMIDSDENHYFLMAEHCLAFCWQPEQLVVTIPSWSSS